MGDLKIENDSSTTLPFSSTLSPLSHPASSNTSDVLNQNTSNNNSVLSSQFNESIICDVAEKLHLKLLKDMILQLSEEKAVELIFDVFMELKHRNEKNSRMDNDNRRENETTSCSSTENNSTTNTKEFATDFMSNCILNGNTESQQPILNQLNVTIDLKSASNLPINNDANSNEYISSEPESLNLIACPNKTNESKSTSGRTSKIMKFSSKEGNKCHRNSAQISNKLMKHNDITFYPNILCIICQKWVCIRNRFTHIESHLRYRPYKCNKCDYTNRKEIFVELHVKNAHEGEAKVLFEQDVSIEEEAVKLAEKSIKETVRMQEAKTIDNALLASMCRPSSSSNDLQDNYSPLIGLHTNRRTPDKTIKALLNSPSNVPSVQASDKGENKKRRLHCEEDLMNNLSPFSDKFLCINL